MAAKIGASEGGDGESSVPADAEQHILEEELLETESTLVGELQQIESLAREKSKKVSNITSPTVFLCSILPRFFLPAGENLPDCSRESELHPATETSCLW